MAAEPQVTEKTVPGSAAVQPQVGTVRDLPTAATSVKEWIAQIEAATVQVTEVKLKRTDTGLDVVLETAESKPLQIDATKFRTEGNSLIADIPNAVLALPEGQPFTADNPTEEIATVQVVQQNVNSIRVIVTGRNAVPQQKVTLRTGAFAYSLNPEGIELDQEIVVTREGRRTYRVPNASTATRTDTPLRDVPQSIQVVPRQVIEDRNVRNLNEAVETVSGVANGGDYFGATGGGRIIRGFFVEGSFRNGFPQGATFNVLEPVGTIEQVEVLKGPASVLFGAVELGGIVNTITRQPLSEPYYKFAFEAGNYSFYQPSIDLSGPLTADKTLLYRFIASYQSTNYFQEFVNSELTTIAPSITLNFGDRTTLNLYYEYIHFFSDPARSFAAVLSDGSLTPRSFYASYPDLQLLDVTTQKIGYTLKHEFNDNWQLRNNVAITLHRNNIRNEATPLAIVDDRFFTNFFTFEGDYTQNNYFGQIDALGKFNTGSISHQLLVGFDFNRYVEDAVFPIGTTALPDLDILNPNYDVPRPEFAPSIGFDYLITNQSYGVYFQDQIALSNNLKLLIGGRYDWVSYENEVREDGIDQSSQKDGAFSPRIGLVYQPSKTVALYASYSRSFRQTIGFNPDGRAFEPSRGTQYEVGIKTDFLDGKLSTTLAAYHLTKTNVTTPDPNNPLFSVQTGEQRSQGIELDAAGEILPGWKVIGSYTYTDAKVTGDNVTPVGNRLPNVPENQVSLWTTYEIQTGDLKGLGFGLGLFYVGERQGNLANTFQLKDYLRTDAVLYYRRGGFKAAINVRNLFDMDYADFSYDRTLVQRAKPFTITGSISWEF
ncbi:TonB-dependent siderophore receptor [Floridanema evergladense]|uniref:TonB-dependent siderophore receptor n=1 Tax=Floridaenema evergladense BLCC-F167 TaxID=3153639 RepID=A0ABV4WV93_9CYAN